MRQQQNAHLLLDRSAYDATTRIADVNGTGVRVSGDTILFSTINAYDANTTTFAKNIREKLGLQEEILLTSIHTIHQCSL